MKRQLIYAAIIALLAGACSGQKEADREYTDPSEAKNNTITLPSDSPILEKQAIDLGDVDSGISIKGKLAPESLAENVTAEYIETLRETLSMTTITVKAPFPEKVMVEFTVLPSRDYVERPVVLRARAYREDTAYDGEYGYVLGKEARFGSDSQNRRFTVDALEGLAEIPDTLLLHARADAWLMPEGTDETTLNPMTDTSPDRVSLMSNPVRINFVKEDAEQ